MNLFQKTLKRSNDSRPPVWLMRQAGRYHSHYQHLRKQHSFMDLCKKPEVACEATLGPVRDFGFDAAILFSDLLFPLEAMGMGLEYSPGPKLSWHLKSASDLPRLSGGKALASRLDFQAQAMRMIRSHLPPDKGLLGFVGGPLTLFFYAAEGSHQGELHSALAGLRDGRFVGFCEKLLDLLAENMALQARSGADTVAVLDTCAGEVPVDLYRSLVVPTLRELIRKFHSICPGFPVSYYSKGTGFEHWETLRDLPIACLGVDWLQDIKGVLDRYSERWVIQGNFDPSSLLKDRQTLEGELRAYFMNVKSLPPSKLRGWICGLGHGVLQNTPEDNIRLFMRLQKEIFHE